MFALLYLTIPIFYIIGLVTFIRWIVGNKKPSIDRKSFLKQAIIDLESAISKSPSKTLKKQLDDYKKELKSFEATPISSPTVDPLAKKEPEKEGGVVKEAKVEPKPQLQKDINEAWSNWYSDNSINLLLYIGAFLIVASASIYVGFQWETLGGSFKALILTLLTLAFFGFGAWFYSIPKIKNAGVTFIAIGALLIPFNGLAWHNFVLGPAGFEFGLAWFATSIVSVAVYALLAYVIRHPFYTYIAGFGSLSTLLAVVNISNINQEFYILGGIFSALVLLVSANVFTKSDKEIQKTYVMPLNISSNIIMPVSLLWGILFALGSDRLFSLEVVSSALLSTIYYFTAYLFMKKVGFLYAGLALVPAFIFLVGRWLGFESTHIFLLIQIIAIVYLLVSYNLAKNWSQESESFSIIAHFTLPISLFFIVTSRLSGSIDIYSTPAASYLFTAETTLAVFLATAFYALAYLLKRNVAFVGLASVLFLAGVYFASRWLGIDILPIYYLLEIVIAAYLLVAYLLRSGWSEESQVLTVVGLAFAAGLFFLGFGRDFDAFHLTALAAFPTVFGLAASYIHRESTYLYYNFLFLAVTVYLYFTVLLDLDHMPYILGGAYLGLTVIFYLITIATRNIKGSFQAFAFAAIAFAVLAFVLTLNKPAYFLLANIVYSSILFDAALRFKETNLLYLSNLFVYVALWSVLRILDVKLDWYPLAFAGLSYVFYLFSQVLPESIKNYYRFTSLVGVGVNTLAFGLIGQNTPSAYNYSYDYNYPISSRLSDGVERNALLSSYAALFLYTFDATTVRKASLGYFASAVGMLTYLWQMKFLGIDETQVYTLPVGIYFMALAYTQRLFGKESNRNLLDLIGLGFLFIPTLFQSFDANGAKYALILGLEGILVFAAGISLKYKTYIYAGAGALVVAVISQTYEFIFSLPRWLITAIFGLMFLGTAIYLLLKRSDQQK